MAQLIKTIDGLAIASVKTVNGLANASIKTVDGLDNTSGGGHTYATWNPSDKSSSNVVLSNGNLTYTVSPSDMNDEAVRATIGLSTGKFYFEIQITATANHTPEPGFCALAFNITSELGGTGNSWAYLGKYSTIYTGGGFTGSGFSDFSLNDVLGFAIDCDAKTCQMYKQGSSFGSLITGLPTTIYPSTGSLGGNGGDTMIANFGATTLAYTPPAGYNAGWYT